MKLILIAFFVLANSFASALPLHSGKYGLNENDQCTNVLLQISGLIETTSMGAYTLSSIRLISASQERTYELRFANLPGMYLLILDNDASNRCFLVQQTYIF